MKYKNYEILARQSEFFALDDDGEMELVDIGSCWIEYFIADDEYRVISEAFDTIDDVVEAIDELVGA